MNGLSSLERIILECVGNKRISFTQLKEQTGLHENVCLNFAQSFIIRGILKNDSGYLKINENIPKELINELNGLEAQKIETMEIMEAVLEQEEDKVFKFRKVALDAKDEKIFMAMLSNLDSFLKEAHTKAQNQIPMKERKVIFWGVGEVQKIMRQIISGQ